MTRRELLSTLPAAAMVARPSDRFTMSVEGYIFQQHAAKQQKPLGAVADECLRAAHDAGFRNVELNPAFFAAEWREKVLRLVQALKLKMPSVYVGGVLHEPEAAAKTIRTAVEFGTMCEHFGCKAVVTNPDPKPGNAAKTDEELAAQAENLNRMGRTLADRGFELRVHHHTPQLENNAREWRSILRHTDPQLVRICVDADWAYEGGFDPLTFLRETGNRVRELHVRSAKNKLWLEDVEDSDIDYRAIAGYLKQQPFPMLVVVELAYRPNTVLTRSLAENLRVSRIYTEKAFGIKADR